MSGVGLSDGRKAQSHVSVSLIIAGNEGGMMMSNNGTPLMAFSISVEIFAPIIAEDEFDGVEAREDGVFPSTFNQEIYQQRRAAAQFYDLIPAPFRQQRLSRPLESYTEDVSNDEAFKGNGERWFRMCGHLFVHLTLD